MAVDLKYPVEKFERPEQVTEDQLGAFIAAITETPVRLKAAVAGLDPEQIDTPYRPGGWTVRLVVHHWR
jgi:hypothetical protein